MDAPDHGNTIGCGSQLRSGLGIFRRPALQRKQAYDHLQVVQQSMIGLAAQKLLILNQLVFLTKQALIKSDGLSQLEFGASIFFQFAFITCCRTVPIAFICGRQSDASAVRNMTSPSAMMAAAPDRILRALSEPTSTIMGMPVELAIADDRCEPGPAINVANRQVEQRQVERDKINFVIGPICPAAAMAAAPIYSKAGVIQFLPTMAARY